jgi:hypothetical protein
LLDGPYALSLAALDDDSSSNSSLQIQLARIQQQKQQLPQSAHLDEATTADAWSRIYDSNLALLANKLSRKQWDNLLNEDGVLWIQQLSRSIRMNDLKVISLLTKELNDLASVSAQRNTPKQDDNSERNIADDKEVNNAVAVIENGNNTGNNTGTNTGTVTVITKRRGDRKYVRFESTPATTMTESSSHARSGGSRLASSDTVVTIHDVRHYSFGQVLCSFIVGLIAMGISSAVVIWQLFEFDLLKR